MLILAMPIASIGLSWLGVDAVQWGLMREMAATVLPGYTLTTLALILMVAVGVGLLGCGCAVLIVMFDFPGKRWLTWALLLPLAMPAYVTAYAYTDFLQYSGWLQTTLREVLGLQGRMLPEIRSTGGAALVFIVSLYPYVYLLTRAALLERAGNLLEAAKLMGATPLDRLRRVALPLARPAIGAGIALALMETLADFGVSSYFAVQTFSAGIYKAWLALDNPMLASQLATVLLVFVAIVLWLERRAQRRIRFASSKTTLAKPAAVAPTQLHGWASVLACAGVLLPIVLGFAAPVLVMLHTLTSSGDDASTPVLSALDWAANSAGLGILSAAMAVSIALVLATQQRLRPSSFGKSVTQIVALGYAVPGAVVVVGLLLPVLWLREFVPGTGFGAWLTGGIGGLLWAYMVRFVAVAMQSVDSGFTRIPNSFDDSAKLLGAKDGAIWRRVHWPLLRGPVAAAALLVAVDVMKELPATLVLRPFNTDTLAVMTYQLARDERLGEAALPALALVVVGLIPIIWLSRQLNKPRH
ncbi:putative 2-aminoethylphosphonate transport system permease protein PhnU [Betaproteobacteria bacterium MOLA814]|nr:putative 2-aminoethylphosphonate transport system permease protein PhnU [Betaproteobacteria bacterium MOLA814]